VSAVRRTLGGMRWPAMIAIWAAWGFGVGIVAAVAIPAAFGLHSLTVLTGSMQPTIKPGDMVVDEPIPANAIRVGDIVTYQAPPGRCPFQKTGGKCTITHRARKVTISDGQVHVVTRGDANHGRNAVERWQVPVTGNVGRVAYILPKIGYPITWSHTRNGRLALVSIPALVLAIWALLRIWRSDEEDLDEREVPDGI
jgi:signal peptidase I